MLTFIVSSLAPLPKAHAGDINLPVPGTRVLLSPVFNPAYLQGLTVHPHQPLKFDFIVNPGDEALSMHDKRHEYTRLIKYFLASLAIPEQDQWVNLSPYEHERIIAADFGRTLMGRDLLEEDYWLKQVSSSLMYPESGLGRRFWQKVYARAWAQYHTTDIPVNAFNKVWIVPDQAEVYQSGETAYIIKSHLKVMLQQDYLSLSKHSDIASASASGNGTITALSAGIIRQIILPVLEKEVNEGKNFAPLRQIVSSMVLAAWYKKALKKSFLGRIYADQEKIKGVDQDPKANEAVYKRYLAAFKKGVYNFIKEDEDSFSHQRIPRKYFAGGFAPLTRVDITDKPMAHSGRRQIDDRVVCIMKPVVPVTGADAAMGPSLPLSERFNSQINRLARQLYRSHAERRALFVQKFKLFLDDLDPVIGQRILTDDLYNMGHQFQAIFESRHLLEQHIFQEAMADFNDQARSKPRRFRDSHGLLVRDIMETISWHLIAAYYLNSMGHMAGSNKAGDFLTINRQKESEAAAIIDLIFTVWKKSMWARYGGVMTSYTGYYHRQSHMGHDSWEQVAELLKYVYRKRKELAVSMLMSTLNDLSNREDDRETPRNLEVIVPKVLMVMIPKVIDKPIIRRPANATQKDWWHNERVRLERLLSEIKRLRMDGSRQFDYQYAIYRQEADEILSALFLVGPGQNYDREYFSFNRYSTQKVWRLREDLRAARLILDVDDYIKDLRQFAPEPTMDEIPNMIDYAIDIESDDYSPAMSGNSRPSQRFGRQIYGLGERLYKNDKARSRLFIQEFRRFFDSIDHHLTDRIVASQDLIAIGYQFQPIFESRHLLDEDILGPALDDLNAQVRRSTRKFLGRDKGLFMRTLKWDLIAGYYFRLLGIKMERGNGMALTVNRRHKREAAEIIDLIYTVWSKSIGVRYGVVSRYTGRHTGYFHPESHVGHDSWEQVAELLKYLYPVRDHEDVERLLSELNAISNREDERERPRNLEIIVPKLLMAFIPELTGKPIVRHSADPKVAARLSNQRVRLQALILVLTDLMSEEDVVSAAIKLHRFNLDAELILSDLFIIGKNEFYDRGFFSFHRYSNEEVWQLREDLRAAKLILSADDFFRMYGNHPDDIPYALEYFFLIEPIDIGDFAMVAPRIYSTASTLEMAKKDFKKDLSRARGLKPEAQEIIRQANAETNSILRAKDLYRLAMRTKVRADYAEGKPIQALAVAQARIINFNLFAKRHPDLIYSEVYRQKLDVIIRRFPEIREDRRVMGAILGFLVKPDGERELQAALASSRNLQIVHDAQVIVEFVAKRDFAMARRPADGGIDLNAARLDLQVNGRGIDMAVSTQDFRRLSRINGLVPQIISISPVEVKND